MFQSSQVDALEEARRKILAIVGLFCAINGDKDESRKIRKELRGSNPTKKT